MHGNLFLEEPVADLEKLEEDFVNIVKEKIKSDPENMLMMNKVRIHHNYLASRLGTILPQDAEYTENPLERENVAEAAAVAEVKSLREVYSKLQASTTNLEMVRVPVVEVDIV